MFCHFVDLFTCLNEPYVLTFHPYLLYFDWFWENLSLGFYTFYRRLSFVLDRTFYQNFCFIRQLLSNYKVSWFSILFTWSETFAHSIWLTMNPFKLLSWSTHLFYSSTQLKGFQTLAKDYKAIPSKSQFHPPLALFPVSSTKFYKTKLPSFFVNHQFFPDELQSSLISFSNFIVFLITPPSLSLYFFLYCPIQILVRLSTVNFYHYLTWTQQFHHAASCIIFLMTRLM